MIDRVIAGRYKIIESIGEGGMSRVWRAQDLNTGKAVAVKALRDEFREDETFVRRFEREAQAASRMTHPNIANLLDVGVEEDGTRYLVIEYVSGKTLKQYIQENGALRADTAAQIIIRVLAAVQHAHQNGVIHRDIKPQNILIDKDGTVKVTDFGIARVANTQTMSQDSDVVMGSVYYFSPEQARGAAVDEKSDLYSVGVVFYEMLTGQVPFTGDTPVAIAMRHLQEAPVPPSSHNPAVSPATDFVVLRAMEKRPRSRYQSAADMQRDVRLALEHPDTILATKAELERRDREARLGQRKKRKAERRVRWMRRLLVSAFATLLFVVMAIGAYIVIERTMQARRSTVEVPSFYGMSKEAAIDKAVELGLEPATRSDVYPLVPDNVVAEQSIAPGTSVEPDTVITLFICQSQYQLAMPGAVGLSLEKAQKLFQDNGIIIDKYNYVISAATIDTVIYQEPAVGTPINRGDKVDLTLSAGQVTMPQLIGMLRTEAVQTITAFDLLLGGSGIGEQVVDDPSQIGRVVRQTPEAFSSVRPKTTVAILIGVPKDSWHITEIELDISDLPAGGTVSVSVVMEDGSEQQQFVDDFPDGGGLITIPLYSETARVTLYRVYYDGEQWGEERPIRFASGGN